MGRREYLVAASLAAVSLSAACDKPEPLKPTEPSVVEKAAAFYESRAPFERPVTRATPVKGLPNVRSETCGGCHAEIYAEWKISTHARAWLDDPQFQDELAKSRGKKPGDPDVGWLCVNCHTPAYEQLPQLVVGLTDGDIGKPIYADNPEFDPKMQNEAIGCATCHVSEGKVWGPWGNTRAPHAIGKSDKLLNEQVCTQCHQAEQFYESQNLGCFFDTGKTYAESPAKAVGQTCQDCHMPEVERPLVAGLPARKTRRHWFGGSLIPKKPEFAAELEPLEEIYGDGVSLRVVPATEEHRDIAESQAELAEEDKKLAASKAVACVGDCLELALVITNDRAGHTVPTGDPERHIDFTVTARTGEDVVARAFTRVGSRFQWWPETKRLSDTRVRPGSPRVLLFSAPRSSKVEIVAHKYRMYESAWEHHKLEGRSVRGREFHRSTVDISKLEGLTE